MLLNIRTTHYTSTYIYYYTIQYIVGYTSSSSRTLFLSSLFLLLLLTSLEAAAVCIQSVLCSSICFSDQRCIASPSGLSQQQPQYYCFTMAVVVCTSGGWQKPSLNRSLRDAICLQSTGRGEPAFTSKVISNGKATAAERDLPKLPYVYYPQQI